MSIGSYSTAEASISGHSGNQRPKRPPSKRLIYAKRDAVEQPEAR